MMGACSGGITSCAYAAWAGGSRRRPRCGTSSRGLHARSLDRRRHGARRADHAADRSRPRGQASKLRGVLDGRDLAKVFAWMRPNDLIWNYWVSNYLLGNAPPAFDILFWNNDTTSLPARLHSDYLDLITLNPFRNPGALKLSGTPIDMGKVAARRLCRRRRDRSHHAMEVGLSDGAGFSATRRRSSCRTPAICRACSIRPAIRRRRS